LAEEVNKDDLAQVLGLVKDTVTVGGKTLTVRPMSLAQVAGALIVVDRLVEKGAVELTDAGGKVTRDFKPQKLILRGGEDAIRLLAIATSEELDFIGRLNFVDAAKLFAKVYETNSDFFGQHKAELMEAIGPVTSHVAAVIEELKRRAVTLLAEVILRAGLGASSSSSTQATASTTSEAIPSGS
jgi:hypothetical protein